MLRTLASLYSIIPQGFSEMFHETLVASFFSGSLQQGEDSVIIMSFNWWLIHSHWDGRFPPLNWEKSSNIIVLLHASIVYSGLLWNALLHFHKLFSHLHFVSCGWNIAFSTQLGQFFSQFHPPSFSPPVLKDAPVLWASSVLLEYEETCATQTWGFGLTSWVFALNYIC